MRWTKRELAMLHLYYEKEVSLVRLKNKFPGRSLSSITKKAIKEGLSRDKFSSKGRGFYFMFAKCPECGRILRKNVKWAGKNLSIPKCPICNSTVVLVPRSSKLRRKYRNV